MIAASAAVALIVGTLYTSGLKADDNQDEEDKVERGLAIAPVPLNLIGKDRQLVGLGSYIVNGQIDCNGCHSMGPQTEFAPSGNPYLLPPIFNGKKQINQATYLGGSRDFGQLVHTPGMLDDQLYLIDPWDGTATSVFDFGSIQKGGWPQLMRMTNDGRRLFITMNQAGKVVMFDTSSPEKPRLLRVLDLGPGSGPHYLRLTADERRLVVSDYFLNEDSFGKVHAEGDHKIHVARVNRNNLELDPRFHVDFNTAFATGPARPHGVAFK